jgi:hypothetical protein
VADIAVVLATVLAVGFLLPQILRLRRTHVADGVSATWAAFGTVVNAWWVAYLAHERLWGGLPATVAVVVFYALTLALVLAARPTAVPTALSWGGGYAVFLGAVAAAFGWTVLGTVLGLSYGVQVTPSVWAAYRSPDPYGVSLPTWLLGGAQGVLWGIYGGAHRDAGILVYAAVAVVAATAIVARVAATRSRRPVPTR